MKPRPKKKPPTTGACSRSSSSRATCSSAGEIDTNECCICFRTFDEDFIEETGLDWVECVCGRWLHEECISYNIVTDANGRELLCPFCCA